MDQALLDILVCPITHSRLRREGDFLIAETSGLKYPIKDNLPILLPDAAILPPGIETLTEFKTRFANRGSRTTDL